MLSIKIADIIDLPVIHDLAHRIWPVAFANILSPEQLKYMLEKMYSPDSLQNQFVVSQHNFILVFDEQIPVGFASFSPKEKNSDIYRLHKIYILPQQQGSGTGKLLLTHIINSIKTSGASSLELNVNRRNIARLFYEKQGFAITGEEDIDIGHGYFMNDYVMELAFN
ncbi:MAG: GNAT family N-acetyltransferase [Ginsengibacter sp.]